MRPSTIGKVWRQFRQRVTETAGPDQCGTSPAANLPTWDRATRSVSSGYDPELIQTQNDVVDHLGMDSEEFVVKLVQRHEGRLPQQAFTDVTSWSAATVSRLLSEMEADQQIVRRQKGRENYVYLPPRSSGSVDRQ